MPTSPFSYLYTIAQRYSSIYHLKTERKENPQFVDDQLQTGPRWLVDQEAWGFAMHGTDLQLVNGLVL